MDELTQYTIHPSQSIEEALLAIEENRHRGVIVVDDDGRVVGMLTDGDIRKALLSKKIMSMPVREVMNLNFSYVTTDTRDKAEAIMAPGIIILLPVLDDEMHLVDIIRAY